MATVQLATDKPAEGIEKCEWSIEIVNHTRHVFFLSRSTFPRDTQDHVIISCPTSYALCPAETHAITVSTTTDVARLKPFPLHLSYVTPDSGALSLDLRVPPEKEQTVPDFSFTETQKGDRASVTTFSELKRTFTPAILNYNYQMDGGLVYIRNGPNKGGIQTWFSVAILKSNSEPSDSQSLHSTPARKSATDSGD